MIFRLHIYGLQKLLLLLTSDDLPVTAHTYGTEYKTRLQCSIYYMYISDIYS